MVFNLSDQNSIALQFLFELRDMQIQKDRERFRRNVERIGQILAYEISKTLSYKDQSISTPVSDVSVQIPVAHPVLLTILRAGLPFLQGFLNVFNHSDCGFIGASRMEDIQTIKINVDYSAIPPINKKTVILCDPMLATGSSMVDTLSLVCAKQKPDVLHVACLIAAPEGLEAISAFSSKVSFPVNTWVGAVDDRLNEQFFIVPGLGDAGDLSFGQK